MQPIRRQFTIDSLNKLADIRAFIRESAAELGADPEKTKDLILAVNEATTNIFLHGFQSDPCTIVITVEHKNHTLSVTTLDSGPQFDPILASLPDTSAPLDERQPGGLGVLMMREYSDQLLYKRTAENQNQLVFKAILKK